MNVFVLCSGRCGSKAFIEACSHITNWTSGHETQSNFVGQPPINHTTQESGWKNYRYSLDANHNRVDYPDNHIEADCRLTWFLGLLDETHGDNALYVNLTRNRFRCAMSWTGRWKNPVRTLWVFYLRHTIWTSYLCIAFLHIFEATLYYAA